MNDILIMAGIALSSAGVGAFVAIKISQALGRADKTDAIRAHFLQVRIDRALDCVPPYSRNGNGTVQKIGRILRGER